MNAYEVEQSLQSLTLIIDTREQITGRLDVRIQSAELPYERKKLDFGDYSARCDVLDLSDKVVIERKMNLDELAMCFGSQRKRFEREFEKGKKPEEIIEEIENELPIKVRDALLAW